jgi:hypothetical protein
MQSTEERILNRREEWDNHVSRMSEDRIVTVVRDNVTKGRRSPGRRKKHWSNSFSSRKWISA